jgi:hypothetical protein
MSLALPEQLLLGRNRKQTNKQKILNPALPHFVQTTASPLPVSASEAQRSPWKLWPGQYFTSHGLVFRSRLTEKRDLQEKGHTKQDDCHALWLSEHQQDSRSSTFLQDLISAAVLILAAVIRV